MIRSVQTRWTEFWRSSIGTKTVMAVTGLVLFGFVVAHLTGNLLIYQGREGINAYAEWLREHMGFLWFARIFLIVAVAVHVMLALRLSQINGSARRVRYAVRHDREATIASRSMLLTGTGVALYTLFHLAHFTWGFVLSDFYEARDPAGRHDLYAMLVQGFRVPSITLIYLLAMVVLGLHLWHGMGAFWQTLGLHRTWANRPFRRLGATVAVLIVLGYVSIPISVLLGWVGADV